MAYNEHLCHGVPLENRAMAQLLVNNTNTNKPKTPLVPLCHRLFLIEKKTYTPRILLMYGTDQKPA